MSNFSLNEKINLIATIKIIAKGNNLPLQDPQYKVRLYDKDVFEDDFLGESGLDNTGTAKITFNASAFGDIANLDQYPDFYFTLFKNDQLLFKSKVMENLRIEAIEQFKNSKGEIIDLGTFLVEA